MMGIEENLNNDDLKKILLDMIINIDIKDYALLIINSYSVPLLIEYKQPDYLH